jgi:hypothetical protein
LELTEWNGSKRVDLRFWKDGTVPTKEGVSLHLDQWKALCNMSDVIDDLQLHHLISKVNNNNDVSDWSISFVTSYLIGQSFCVSIGQLFMKWSFLIGSFSSILIGGCYQHGSSASVICLHESNGATVPHRCMEVLGHLPCRS